jgi:protein-disulfide isomerase
MLRKTTQLFIFLALSLISFTVLAQSAQTILRDKNDPVGGDKNGKVTLVVFFDYQCSHCVSMSPVISSIMKANPTLRVVFKDFPIRGDVSEAAARAAIASNHQGKYIPFHLALMHNAASLDKEEIFTLAKQAGINVDKLKNEMNSSEINQQLKTNFELAEKLGINGTPAFLIAKTDATDKNQIKVVLGEMSQAELQQAINNVK